jgi:hypothetical protein
MDSTLRGTNFIFQSDHPKIDKIYPFPSFMGSVGKALFLISMQVSLSYVARV